MTQQDQPWEGKEDQGLGEARGGTSSARGQEQLAPRRWTAVLGLRAGETAKAKAWNLGIKCLWGLRLPLQAWLRRGMDRGEGRGERAHRGSQSSGVQVLVGGLDRPPGPRLTVTLKVMAFWSPSGEICSSSATAWISRALTTEATSCASVCVKHPQDCILS